MFIKQILFHSLWSSAFHTVSSAFDLDWIAIRKLKIISNFYIKYLGLECDNTCEKLLQTTYIQNTGCDCIFVLVQLSEQCTIFSHRKQSVWNDFITSRIHGPDFTNMMAQMSLFVKHLVIHLSICAGVHRFLLIFFCSSLTSCRNTGWSFRPQQKEW